MLSSKSLVVDVVSIRVFHPLNREGITEARVNVSSVYCIIWVAVVTPRALMVVGSGHSIDTGISSKVGEHGTRFTSFDIKNELVEHLLLSHGVNGRLELIGIEVR